MSSLFKVHSFQTESRDGAFHFFRFQFLKDWRYFRELFLKINCCSTRAFILDDKIFIQLQVFIYVQKFCVN